MSYRAPARSARSQLALLALRGLRLVSPPAPDFPQLRERGIARDLHEWPWPLFPYSAPALPMATVSLHGVPRRSGRRTVTRLDQPARIVVEPVGRAHRAPHHDLLLNPHDAYHAARPRSGHWRNHCSKLRRRTTFASSTSRQGSSRQISIRAWASRLRSIAA